MKNIYREWVIAFAVLAFGLFTIFYLIPAQIEITEEYELKSLSPAFFPRVATWIITGLSVLLLISLFRSPGHQTKDTRGMTVGDEFRVVIAMVIAVIYVLAFKYMGFIPASCLGLAALFFLQGKRRPFRLAFLSVGTAVIIYLIFYYLMKVRFPDGIWLR